MGIAEKLWEAHGVKLAEMSPTEMANAIIELAAQEAEKTGPIIELTKSIEWPRLTQDEAAVKAAVDVAARIRKLKEQGDAAALLSLLRRLQETPSGYD